ncbi:Hypothetical predicted protein [Olea europaea subsp. europaea]|uniref:Uncharacterized protein n=1 Tax=Olea europaea subsp. europaea TaxID=158383 RepID=A0A8S0RPT3_OLEEU|nr:Hypothetical predicted protein [Olea europaea subsp. europaea]
MKDRLKIEKAEAEEKKMREPEREMAGIEDDDGGDEALHENCITIQELRSMHSECTQQDISTVFGKRGGR